MSIHHLRIARFQAFLQTHRPRRKSGARDIDGAVILPMWLTLWRLEWHNQSLCFHAVPKVSCEKVWRSGLEEEGICWHRREAAHLPTFNGTELQAWLEGNNWLKTQDVDRNDTATFRPPLEEPADPPTALKDLTWTSRSSSLTIILWHLLFSYWHVFRAVRKSGLLSEMLEKCAVCFHIHCTLLIIIITSRMDSSKRENNMSSANNQIKLKI